MTNYTLLNKNGKEMQPLIIIDEDAKEDFKDMMGWNEEQWEENTQRLND